jgi:Ca2+/Na+ antiporter
MAGISTLTIVVYLFLLWLSFFKTSWIIDRLRLEKGMENQKIEFPTDRKVILSIVIMVTGGFILVRSIPGLLGSLYQFSQNSNVLFQHRVSANGIIIKVSEALIGLLLFVYGTPIGNYIDKKTKNEITEEGNNVDTNHE